MKYKFPLLLSRRNSKITTITYIALLLCASLALAVPASLFASAKKKVTVTYSDNAVQPKKVKIAKGGRVTWKWNTSNPHNVASDTDKSVRSGDPTTSGKYLRAFPKTGTFRFICQVHPSMVTTVSVVKH